jgi:hypothetical protein
MRRAPVGFPQESVRLWQQIWQQDLPSLGVGDRGAGQNPVGRALAIVGPLGQPRTQGHPVENPGS